MWRLLPHIALQTSLHNMHLSVIIPTFNRAQLLDRALTSVYAQKPCEYFSTIEVIVVDDGSRDNTAALVAEKFPQANYLYQENLGVSAARNKGLAAASGEWLALLDSDDEWLPHKLATQFSNLNEAGLLVCHTEEIWVRNGVRVNQMNKHKKAGGDVFERCLPLCAMSPSSIVLHRSIFEQVGEFDESLPACEDYDLWLRIAANYKVAYVEEPCIIKYGGHDDQLSRAFWGMDRFRVIALAKLLRQASSTDSIRPLSESQRVSTLAMLKKKNTILLNGARKHMNDELIKACEARITEFNL